jgi:GT2 family glycosyltransferase
MSSIGVTVIIVNWHSADLLGALFDSLAAQSVQPARVVVVNNGDSTVLPLARYITGPVDVIEMGRNAGFAAANNLAVRSMADTEWIALLNPDTIVATDWLEKLIEAAMKHPEVAAFGSKQLMEPDRTRVDGLGDVYHVSGAAWRACHGQTDTLGSLDVVEIFSPCGAAVLYRRDVFLEAGGFDEDYFCYFEDVDLGFRLRLLGHRCLLVPEARVYHQGSATSGGRHSDFAVYHGHRNLIWTYVKNMPTLMFWWYLPQHLIFNLASLLVCAKRSQGRVIARALRDAMRNLPNMLVKRRKLQLARHTGLKTLQANMKKGWLTPYVEWQRRN